MAKLKLDASVLKTFLANHVEKFALGAVVFAGGWLLYQGLHVKNYAKNRTPGDLDQLASKVRSDVDVDHWSSISTSRPVPTDLPTRALPVRIDGQRYPLQPLEQKTSRVGVKREDPTLLAPEDLRVTGVLGALAYEVDGKLADPMASLADAEPIKVDQKPKTSERRKRSSGMGGYPGFGGGGFPGMPGGGDSKEGDKKDTAAATGPKRMLNSKYDLGFRPGTESSGFGYPFGGPGAGGASDGPSDAGGGFGIRPGGGNKNKNTPAANETKSTLARTAWFIAGTAPVPHRELHDEFERVFKGAQGYNPQRDVPVYAGFQVQRADVTDKSVDQLTDDDWMLVTSNSALATRREKERWAGQTREVINQQYADPSLTMPIPPIMLRDPMAYASHPRVPKEAVVEQPAESGNQQEEKEGDGTEKDEGETSGQGNAGFDASRSGSTAGQPPSGGGYPGMPGAGGGYPGMPGAGGGYPGMPGAGGGYPGMPGAGGGYPGMPGAGGGYPGMPGAGGGYPGMPGAGGGYPGMPGAGGGYPGMPGAGGGYPGMPGFGAGASAVAAFVPEVKLIRFYDFHDPKNANSPQPGRRYVYRVQAVLVDPNYPREESQQPAWRYLAAETFERVQKLLNEDKAAGKGRSSYLYTPWSAPSSVVALPPKAWTVAGPIDPAKYVELGQPPVIAERDSAQSHLVAVQWDDRRAIDVPAPLDGVRGAVAYRKLNAEVVNPVDLSVKQLPDAVVDAGVVVVDIAGGQELAVSRKADPLDAPGEMLIFDGNGGLKVLDDLDDFNRYRMYTFADDIEAAEEAASKPSGSGGAAPGAGGGASPGGGGPASGAGGGGGNSAEGS